MPGPVETDYEFSIRNILLQAKHIKCPLILEHGTADETVPCSHANKLESKLKELGKKFDMQYYEGGSHSLMPTISKLDAFTQRAPESIDKALNNTTDDFLAGNVITVDCGSKKLVIDWSENSDSVNLFKWV